MEERREAEGQGGDTYAEHEIKEKADDCSLVVEQKKPNSNNGTFPHILETCNGLAWRSARGL